MRTNASLLSILFKKIFGEKSTNCQSTFCTVCGNAGVGFRPLSAFYRENAIRYGFAYFAKCEMLSVDAYSCINCGASDRERLYAQWINQQVGKSIEI